jgi:hypothetical protein
MVKAPEGFSTVVEGDRVEVYRRIDETRSVLVGTADGFAEAAYIEGRPALSRRVSTLAEAIDYIVATSRKEGI